MENRGSIVVVTGASSGIGNACATFLAKKGNKVYGSCRSPSSYSRKADEFFEMLAMDQTDGSSVAKAAEKIFQAEGRVDSLVCCAGSGLAGSIEDTTIEEAEALMEVNFFGTLRTVKAFLPSMRETGKGRILIVGGLEGLAATPFQGLFSAGEFALEGLAEALRGELFGSGVEVGIVELASFRTPFGQRRVLAGASSAPGPYKKRLETALGVLSRDEARGYEPLAAARIIHAALSARRLPIRSSAGGAARRILAFSRRWLPARAFESLVRKYYRLG